MKYFPFKTLVVCIFMPAVLYGFSIQALERYLKYQYTLHIEQVYIGDTRPLFAGTRRLKDNVRENLNRFLKERALPAWAVTVNVLVSTKHGSIIYPATFQDLDPSILPQDTMTIARKNFTLLNEGLVITVDVTVAFGSPVSLAILALYILAAVTVLYGFYRSGIRRARHEEKVRNREIRQLRKQEGTYGQRLDSLENERQTISAELDRMKAVLEDEKAKADINESEMFQEIVSLDEKLKENLNRQQRQLKEIGDLREKIANYETELQKSDRQKTKESDLVSKRFGTIYKNVVVGDRAVEGFIDLSDEMRIKAEELIHRLNDEPDQVTIKRKVFGKKGRETVLEVLFSYNGRLYFRRLKNQTVEVLTIGTKNSQNKDLDYIDKVARKPHSS